MKSMVSYSRKEVLIVILYFVMFSMHGQNSLKDNAKTKIFTLLQSSTTGVDFNNSIVDSYESNILIYEAFYSGAGVSIGDINNDGLPDLYFAGNQVGDKLYLNQGDLKFKDITIASGILNKGGWSTGVNIIDINGDGFKDIYVCKSLYDDYPELRQNELYINNGDLTFTEAARDYNLSDPFRAMQANFFDYDKDGDFDLFLINQPPNPSLLSPMKGPNWLNSELTYRFLKNNNGKFENITSQAGLENVGYGLSSVVGDFNNDGWQDLYVANDYEGPDFFYMNNKDGTFSNKIDDYLKHISFFSMGADVSDINNDGLLDLAVVDMVAEDNYRLKANMGGMNPKEFWNIVDLGGHYQYMFNALQLNNGLDSKGNLNFSEIGQLAGVSNTDWSWSPLFADFDNNGHQDLFITNGIKKDVRNTDALKEIDKYLAKLVDRHEIKNVKENIQDLRKVASLDTLLSFFPSEKLANHIFKNEGNLEFTKAQESWGIDQPSFSSGAAYGDLDNDGDLDLVINNVDDEAFIYENNSAKISKNKFLNVKFKNEGKNVSFFGTKATAYFNGQLQSKELTSARGFYSSSEELIHFGMGNIKKIDSLVISWYDGGTSILTNVKTGQILTIDKSDLAIKKAKTLKKDNVAIFKDVTSNLKLEHRHNENDFDDFEREVLLPHEMSAFGPTISVGDVNGDQLEDIFIGGSVSESGAIYVQNNAGEFIKTGKENYNGYAYHEDMGSALIDVDLDGDLDLYVASGSNEYDKGISLYQDRLYKNNGAGSFTLVKEALPNLTASTSRVIKADYDNDGDLDLFVCGRQVPGHYPEPADSYLLKNNWKETGKFQFVKVENPILEKLGMVTDATWSDFDSDGDLDIMVVGEWMPFTILENNNGHFEKIELDTSLNGTTGWWYSLEKSDIDNDGDEDFILGNLGLNYKYKASKSEPFTVNYGDFDQNGKNDIVLGYYNYGEHYPLRGRSCSSQQIPELKKIFPNYDTFAQSSLLNVYGKEVLDQSLEYRANMFQSVCLENLGNGKFEIHELPRLAQLSSINDIVVRDFDQDGQKDLLIAGNMYGSEVETTRNDSSIGMYLKGDGGFNFQAVPQFESGLNLPFDVKEMKPIKLKNGKGIIIGINDDPIKIIAY